MNKKLMEESPIFLTYNTLMVTKLPSFERRWPRRTPPASQRRALNLASADLAPDLGSTIGKTGVHNFLPTGPGQHAPFPQEREQKWRWRVEDNPTKVTPSCLHGAPLCLCPPFTTDVEMGHLCPRRLPKNHNVAVQRFGHQQKTQQEEREPSVGSRGRTETGGELPPRGLSAAFSK